MQELIGSMVRFSTALTLFGLQQMRYAMSAMVETPMSLDRFRQAVDSAANALTAKIDDQQKTTLNSVNTLSADVIAKTYDSVKNTVADPGRVLRATSDALRRTAETCTSVLNRTTSAAAGNPAPATGSGEPQPAADVLNG
jgi:hypothetical protein